MFCNKCGHNSLPGATFCTKCGSTLNELQTQPPPQKSPPLPPPPPTREKKEPVTAPATKKGNSSIAVVVVVIAVLLLTVAGLAYFKLGSPAEVLNSFDEANNALQASNGSLGEKNSGIYRAFDKQLAADEVKTRPYYARAQRAKAISTELNRLLYDYKQQIIKTAGGIDPETNKIAQPGNVTVATRMFVTPGAGAKRGAELQRKIREAHKNLLDLVDLKDRAMFKIALDAGTPRGKGQANSWAGSKFNLVPSIAALTVLSKIQNDLVCSEGAIVEYLIKKVGETDFKFESLTAKIIAPSSCVIQGDAYKADIFLASYNGAIAPEVFLGPVGAFHRNGDGSYNSVDSRDPLPPGYSESGMLRAEGGMAKMEAFSAGVGEKKYTGIIRTRSASGGYTYYPFEAGYQVVAKAAVISPAKMNVFYIGVDNPVNISVPGVSSNDVSASLAGAGTLTKNSDGTYSANVTGVGKCSINVWAKIDGKVQPMGSQEYRIKRIPDPIPSLGGKLFGGNSQPGSIQTNMGVVALLKDFDFDARFSVVSFQMVYCSKGEIFKAESQGPLFNANMKAFVDRAKPKDIIFLDEIKVVGPDNQPRKLGQVAFTII